MKQTIPIRTEFNIHHGDALTYNVEPLMHEIRHALKNLGKNGDNSIIDLRSLPLAPGEEQRIVRLLGKGEVTSTLQALGRSDIYETAFPGVWMVTHYNDDEEVISRFIEVTRIPEIMLSQTADISDSHRRLGDLLDNGLISSALQDNGPEQND